MFEKVNPSHPDKVADRIAGAMVDLAYANQKDPKVAGEVLIGHGNCHIIAESSFDFKKHKDEVEAIVKRISEQPTIKVDLKSVCQDGHLAANQNFGFRCGDNGIFKGVVLNDEEMELSNIARDIYAENEHDGKYILDERTATLIICQSRASDFDIMEIPAVKEWYRLNIIKKGVEVPKLIVNPLGFWTGGTNVDTGATNRKLGSDMGRAVTGGGLHGKDLSKADVSVSIYAHLKAQYTHKPVEIFCAIGDEQVDGRPYSEIVEIARAYIKAVGGFEKFAEWGII